MSEEADSAHEYRERAAMLRTIAADKAAAAIRYKLLELADTYDRLALTNEAIDAANIAMGGGANGRDPREPAQPRG
jgi:hypothetical protein